MMIARLRNRKNNSVREEISSISNFQNDDYELQSDGRADVSPTSLPQEQSALLRSGLIPDNFILHIIS
jgi:hypothetical protein